MKISRKLNDPTFIVSIGIIIFLLFLAIVNYFVVEVFWFQELGYVSIFFKKNLTQLFLWLFVSGLSIWFLAANLTRAEQDKWISIPSPEVPQKQLLIATQSSKNPTIPQSIKIRLPLLILIVFSFSILITLMVIYYSQVAYQIWHIDYTLPKVTPPLPSPFQFNSASQLFWEVSKHYGQIIIGLIASLIILFKPRLTLYAIAIIISLIFGLVVSGNWTTILQSIYATPFNQIDPQFNLDISFYIFNLPVWQLLDFWLGGLFLYGLIAVLLTYLLSANSLSEGKFPGFSVKQLHHLYALIGAMILVISARHWLDCYSLLYSERGVIYGAGYTDVQVQIYVEITLAIIALIIGIWFFWKAIIYKRKTKKPPAIPFSVFPFTLYIVILIGGYFSSQIVQSVEVQPNEIEQELPYIQRNISMTRAAFDLDKIEVKTFDPKGELTAADLEKNHLTIDNIRLWDTRPLLQSNRQLQQIRPYYQFPDADIDRYTIKTSANQTEKQQVIIAARELDYNAVPKQAETWVNKRLVYTHGYGFTLSPVNRVDDGGLPYYYVKDIGNISDEGALITSSEYIRESIPIGKPRIYFGELTNNYIMALTQVPELDFPSGAENIYNIYDGTGGITIGSWWYRLLFGAYLHDYHMIFTRNFTPKTRLLLRRNINQRVRAIAPFLQYDQDPYLVATDTENSDQSPSSNYLYWIIDAYTTSNYYPYSDPGNNNFNYIRNSVKVVIDAYNGDTTFYISDSEDPIIQTWNKVFPELFKPLDAMPANLLSHIRYPQDLFSTQSERLLTYHMTDPQIFYNREDQWQIPLEIYGTESLEVKPYYLIMKLPTATAEEFILVHVYTPKGRNNLIAVLFGRSDEAQYGKLLLYQLPKQKLIYGPEQVEALINQDPIISRQISLWTRQGSKAIQGNLLVIPVENSLLYVEPLYLEADKNSLPILARVIVVYENKIIMADTLNKALEGIFQPPQSSENTIIQPLEGNRE